MQDLRIPDLNQVIIAGRLTHPPDFRLTPSGHPVVNLHLAVNRNYRNRQGDWQQDTTFASVIAWGKTAEAANDHLDTGSAVLVDGRLQSRTVENHNGSRTYLEVTATTIQFLTRKSTADKSNGQGTTPDEESTPF